VPLTEHHLGDNTLDTMVLTKYSLGAKFCRNILKKGEVHIFIYESIKFTNINLEKICKEKDLEVCVVKLYLLHYELCITAIYRSPLEIYNIFT
jgi:hypothetical protein